MAIFEKFASLSKFRNAYIFIPERSKVVLQQFVEVPGWLVCYFGQIEAGALLEDAGASRSDREAKQVGQHPANAENMSAFSPLKRCTILFCGVVCVRKTLLQTNPSPNIGDVLILDVEVSGQVGRCIRAVWNRQRRQQHARRLFLSLLLRERLLHVLKISTSGREISVGSNFWE